VLLPAILNRVLSLGHTVPTLRNIAEDEGQERARDDRAREGPSPDVAQ
jgi:hypothetical protein